MMSTQLKTAEQADPHATQPLPEWVRNAPRFCEDPAATARGLRSVIEEEAAECERIQCLTPRVQRALIESGIYGTLIPKEFGGCQADPQTYIDVVEELAYADGAIAWTVMASGFAAANAAIWLGPKAVKAMFEDGEGFIAAGQVAPTGKAERVEGGYRISGKFQFASGSELASWFLGAYILQEEGKPALSAEGKPQIMIAFAPRAKVRIMRDSWNVAGLAATGSYDYEVTDQIVDDDFVMVPAQRQHRGGASYDIGVSIGHVAWALGVAKRALDEIQALATRKKRVGRITLIDQPTFQRDFAMAKGQLEASRAYVRSVYRDWLAAAEKQEGDIEAHALGRLAACWATKTCTEIGQFAFLASGSDGLRNADDNRLQRCFRDLHAGAPHRHVDDNVLLDAATVVLGVNKPGLDL
ncbi:acyl-CoA dehydrogenase family protein [Sphingomonas montanisoli]|nr:acyl-CoA dehydrogenase family protein [Sphingomonas montanisoli]